MKRMLADRRQVLTGLGFVIGTTILLLLGKFVYPYDKDAVCCIAVNAFGTLLLILSCIWVFAGLFGYGRYMLRYLQRHSLLSASLLMVACLSVAMTTYGLKAQATQRLLWFFVGVCIAGFTLMLFYMVDSTLRSGIRQECPTDVELRSFDGVTKETACIGLGISAILCYFIYFQDISMMFDEEFKATGGAFADKGSFFSNGILLILLPLGAVGALSCLTLFANHLKQANEGSDNMTDVFPLWGFTDDYNMAVFKKVSDAVAKGLPKSLIALTVALFFLCSAIGFRVMYDTFFASQLMQSQPVTAKMVDGALQAYMTISSIAMIYFTLKGLAFKGMPYADSVTKKVFMVESVETADSEDSESSTEV